MKAPSSRLKTLALLVICSGARAQPQQPSTPQRTAAQQASASASTTPVSNVNSETPACPLPARPSSSDRSQSRHINDGVDRLLNLNAIEPAPLAPQPETPVAVSGRSRSKQQKAQPQAPKETPVKSKSKPGSGSSQNGPSSSSAVSGGGASRKNNAKNKDVNKSLAQPKNLPDGYGQYI
jgi:hypothetical protein